MAGTINKCFKESVPFHLVLLATVGLIAYSNSFHIPFQWDGIDHIVKNGSLKDLGNFIGAKTLKSNRYISYLTFALNYKIHGLQVTGYHVINLFIHILNAILCYGIALFTFRTPSLSGFSSNINPRYIALFTGLLFVSHPIQTEAVTYIVQRFTSLSTLFYLASLAAYIKSRLSFRKAKRFVFYILSMLSAVLAMKTKEIAFTLPLIIAIYEFMFFRDALRKKLLYLMPLLLTMLIIPLGVLDVEKPLDEIIGSVDEATRVRDVSRIDYYLTQSRVIVTYLRLLIFPINQHLYYDHPKYHSFLNPSVFLSFLFLSGIFVLGTYLLFHSRFTNHPARLIAFGIFWFFITLSVESSIIPLHVIYEHRLYLPSAGAFLTFATGAMILVNKSTDIRIKSVVVSCLTLIPLVLSYATYSRNSVWQSEISLWEDVVRASPHKAEVHNNLGKSYFAGGLTDEAIEEYRIALRIRPTYVKAHNNLGVAYGVKGLIDKAIEEFQITLELKPDYAESHNNLGVAYKSKGLTKEALEQYSSALRIKPDYADAHFNLGLIFLEEGLPTRARKEFQATLRIKPDFHKARKLLEQTDA